MTRHVFSIFLSAAAPSFSLVVAEELSGQSAGYALENGDLNGDFERDVSDGIHLLGSLFLGTSLPVPLATCAGAAPGLENGDINADADIDISDTVHFLAWLFSGGPAPAAACEPGDGLGGRAGNNPRVIPPHARPHGKTYAEWAVQLWRWALAIPAGVNPIFGGECSLSQSGPVWFLVHSGDGSTRSCTVPAGKSILVPMYSYLNDYPCPDPEFQPAPGQSLADFLTEGARFIIDHVTELEAEVDGVALKSLFQYRSTSGIFSFTGDPSLTSVLDPCLTGAPQDGVTDGYWLLLAPLSAGTHTIRIRAHLDFPEFEFSFDSVGVFELEVGRGK